MINRKQFKEFWNDIRPGLGDDDSGLWVPEQVKPHKPSKWFVCVKPVKFSNEYWTWCNLHCRGQILSYSSDFHNQQEWWGFTHKDDIALWLLKWS